jgi:hypothetical protein
MHRNEGVGELGAQTVEKESCSGYGKKKNGINCALFGNCIQIRYSTSV